MLVVVRLGGGEAGQWSLVWVSSYPACDVSPRELLDTAELHNDSNEIEQSGNGGVEQLLQERYVLRSG